MKSSSKKRNRKRSKYRDSYELYYSIYKWRCDNSKKKTKPEFDLSLTYFTWLVQQPCHYCDAPPSVPKQSGIHEPVNGIDRIVNEIGYTEGNCIPCCGRCNRLKHRMSLEEFAGAIIELMPWASHYLSSPDEP